MSTFKHKRIGFLKRCLCRGYLIIVSILLFGTILCYFCGNSISNYREIKFRNRKSMKKTEFVFKNNFDTNSEAGKSFNSKWNAILDKLNLLNVQTLEDEIILSSTPVIVTAISSNHLEPCKDFLRSIKSIYNDTTTVLIYDLSLKPQERADLLSEFGSIIREIRKFAFHKYPYYVRKLRSFRWKPLIIAEILNEFPSIWWMDSSVRVFQPLDFLYRDYQNCTTRTCKYYHWLLVVPSWHSVYSATDSRMYDYLPLPTDLGKTIRMWTTVQLIFGTKEVRDNVLRYLVLCALEENCMDPPNSNISCQFGNDTFNVHGGCHRQDQSAINIILSTVNNFTETKYSRDSRNAIMIQSDPEVDSIIVG